MSTIPVSLQWLLLWRSGLRCLRTHSDSGVFASLKWDKLQGMLLLVSREILQVEIEHVEDWEDGK